MNTVAEYGALLAEVKPAVIRTERQHQAYLQLLEQLTAKQHVSSAERKLIELLTVLIENYEAKQYPAPEASPVDIVRHLMEAHNLRQKDLADVFGTESIVSEVLRGKRELTKEHVRRLSSRFHISPAVFYQA